MNIETMLEFNRERTKLQISYLEKRAIWYQLLPNGIQIEPDVDHKSIQQAFAKIDDFLRLKYE